MKSPTACSTKQRVEGSVEGSARQAFTCRVALALVIAMLASVSIVVGPVPAAQAQTAPTYARTIGGPGLTEMNPGGLDVDAAGNVYVTNTGNLTIAKYPAGSTNAEWVVGELGAPITEGAFFQPRDIAVTDANLYVAEPNGRVQILGLDGSHIRVLDFPFKVPIGVSAGNDAAGNPIILVSDGTTGNVEVFDLDDNHLLSVPPLDTTSGTRDAATDSQGNIYIADYRGDQIIKFDPTGTILLGTFGGEPGTPCEAMVKPYGVAIDADDRVYVAESTVSRLAVYDTDGGCLGTYGEGGDGPLQLDKLRRVAVGRGASPKVYAGDLWGRKILIYNQNGTLAAPARLGDPTIPDAGLVNRASSIAVSSDGVFVTDEINHRIVSWDHDGSNPSAFGEKGKSTNSATFNWPQGIGIDPASGNIWVGDTHTHIVRRFTSDGVPVGAIGGTQGNAPGEWNWPMSTVFDAAGNAYIADSLNRRVQSVDQTGATRWVSTTFLGRPTGIAIDEANGRLLIPDSVGTNIRVVSIVDGGMLPKLPIEGGSEPGQLAQPGAAVVDVDGSIWVADTGNNRVQKFDSDGTFSGIVIGGLDRGDGNNEFNTPRGIAIYDGELYVADTFNHRVQVYNLDGTVEPDLVAPTGTISFPVDEQALTVSPITVAGIATDDVAVANVQVIVRDKNTGQWLRTDGSFGGYQRLDTLLASPGAASTTWTFTFTPPTNGDYGVGVIATDTSGNEQPAPRPWRDFTVEIPVGTDVTPPDASIGSPTEGQTVTTTPLIVSGDATDDVAVAWVQITVKDRATNLWLQPDGSFGASYARLDTTLSDQGATATDWTFVMDPAVDGDYSVRVIATDASGNVQVGPRPRRDFSVLVSTGTDVEPPTSTVSFPVDEQTVAASPINFAGQAADDVGVAIVQITIKDKDANQWLRSDGSFGLYQRLDTSLTDPDAPVTGWAFTVNTLPEGNYAVAVISTDTSNNEELKPRQRADFSVVLDVGPPAYVTQVSDPAGVAPLYPAGAVADGLGNIYVADSGGDRVSRINADGSISLISSAGYNRPRAIAFDSNPGRLWVADTTNNRIVQIGLNGTIVRDFDDGTVQAPFGIAADASGVYVSDTYNFRAVKLSKTDGSVIWEATSCFGTAIGRTRGLTIGSDGAIYIADTDNHRIVSLSASTGACLSSFGSFGSGPGQMKRPQDVESDGAGGLFIADLGNFRVQHVSNDGTFLAESDGSVGSQLGSVRSMDCVYADGDAVGVCDPFQYRLTRFDASSDLDYLDTVGGVAPAPGGFNQPFGVAYSPSGELYVSDMFNQRVQKLNADLTFALEWGGKGSAPGLMTFPRGLTVSSDGTRVILTNSENNRIDVFGSDGALLESIRPTGTNLTWSYQNVEAPDGSYWIADTQNDRIVHIEPDGTVLSEFDNGGQISRPRGIALDADGDLYVANAASNQLEKYSPDGTLLAVLATPGNGLTNVRSPNNLTIDDRGGESLLYIADTGNHRVLVLALDGTHRFTFGSFGDGPGELNAPRSVSINPVDGSVAVADFRNNRISIWQ